MCISENGISFSLIRLSFNVLDIYDPLSSLRKGSSFDFVDTPWSKNSTSSPRRRYSTHLKENIGAFVTLPAWYFREGISLNLETWQVIDSCLAIIYWDWPFVVRGTIFTIHGALGTQKWSGLQDRQHYNQILSSWLIFSLLCSNERNLKENR